MAAKQRTSSISTIFFDLDNTLIPTRKGDKLTCNKLSEILWQKYDVPVDIATSTCSSFLKAFRKCTDNTSMDLETWRRILWSQALGDKYKHLAKEIYMEWLHLRYIYLALTPEIKALLNMLRQTYLLGLITNGTSHSQWEKVHSLDLKTFFDVISVSGDFGWEKPQERIFHQACCYLGVEPHHCIMVGDKLSTDILGGIQAKLGGTVWVPLASADLDQTAIIPTFIIKSVLDLPSLLPNNPKVPAVRARKGRLMYKDRLSLPDLEDCSSNSSDGS